MSNKQVRERGCRFSALRQALPPSALPLVLLAVLPWLLLPAAVRAQAGGDMRDFPPLASPEQARPAPPQAQPGTFPKVPEAYALETPAEQEPYLIGVGDDLTVSVLGQPNFTAAVKVRPDGAITTPAAGTIYVLGRTPDDVSREIERKLDQYLRHPRVDLLVNNTVERKVYVMGEVYNPGERPYRPGVTALQSIAQAGGLRITGKANSVLVLRRTGQESAVFYRRDMTEPLKGHGRGEDMVLQPYDIVFVPRTFIGSVGVFVDSYLRPALVPFTLYLEGWDAFNINNPNARLTGGR